MANQYKLATGHDNEAGFATLSFPVTCPGGIQYPVYRKSASGVVTGHGAPFVVCVAENLTDAQYNELFTASGMSTSASVASHDVTAAIPVIDRTDTFDNYNATLEHQKGVDAEYKDRRWQNVRWKLTKLVAT